MKFHAMASAVVLFLVCTGASAQDPKTPQGSANSKGEQASQGPFSTYDKIFFARMKTILVSSAEKMPEENYNFKPTEAVRSYGQIVGHLADAQYNFCSLALGETNPGLKIEQSKTTKADFGMDMPKFGVLNINNAHDMEHYGNLVTYMRLKNIVPPTSEQAPPAPQKK